MPARRWIGRLTPVLIGVGLALAGCTTPPDDANPSDGWREAYRLERETRMTQTWVGRTRADLESVWGAPTMVTTPPGPILPPQSILVYMDRDKVGGCIDTFAVLRDEPGTVVSYFCR